MSLISINSLKKGNLALSLLNIQFLVIFASFKKAIQDSENDNDDDFLKVREKTSEEKVV